MDPTQNVLPERNCFKLKTLRNSFSASSLEVGTRLQLYSTALRTVSHQYSLLDSLGSQRE